MNFVWLLVFKMMKWDNFLILIHFFSLRIADEESVYVDYDY